MSTVPFTPDGSGTITYSIPIEKLQESKGIFSFTFYTRSDQIYQVSKYLYGLESYLKICEKLSGWKVVIYTDNDTIENINKDASSLYLTYDQEIVLEDLNNFDFRSFGRINAQYQEKTSNVRMASQPIISNEVVDANTQDKNSIG